MPSARRETVLYKFRSPKGQNYIGYCVWRANCVVRRNKRLLMPSPRIGLTENVPCRCFAGRCKELVVPNGGLKFLKSFLRAVRKPAKLP